MANIRDKAEYLVMFVNEFARHYQLTTTNWRIPRQDSTSNVLPISMVIWTKKSNTEVWNDIFIYAIIYAIREMENNGWGAFSL